MIKNLILTGVIILISGQLFAQSNKRHNAGLGLRLGDPLGITYKYYMPRQTAVEVNFGSTYGYGGYYRNNFGRLSRYDNYNYLGHSLNYSFAVQGRMLFHRPLPETVDGLDWYYGIGGQLRMTSIEYEYRKQAGFIEYDRIVDLGIGPDLILGMEFKIPDVPLSAFIDLNLFVELVDDPLNMRLQGGVGVRYNFSWR